MKKARALLAALALVGAGSACKGGGGSGGGTAGTTGGTILFDVSGESLSLTGYAFPPATAGDPAFVDGWEVTFSEVLVTIDKITLSESPDTNPGNQSVTGKLVGEVDGPWAVDLHQGGPIPGKAGSGEQAAPIATLDNQNKNGGAPFSSDSRYAFGFDVVPATASAKLVNLGPDAATDYQMMQAKGYTVLYVGTATFKGKDCTPADPELDRLPKVVRFKLGFKSPTRYSNCQNPDNDPAKPLGSEEHERGVVVKPNQQAIAQLTIHTDHPFWESFVHDSPAHFDMIAAQYTETAGVPNAVLEDMIGVDPTGIADKQNHDVPWRTCISTYAPPGAGQMSFDTQGITVNPLGNPRSSIRDLYDFMTYNQSTQGHLNSNGLCFVERHYASPR